MFSGNGTCQEILIGRLMIALKNILFKGTRGTNSIVKTSACAHNEHQTIYGKG
jgi:hypothetical protein